MSEYVLILSTNLGKMFEIARSTNLGEIVRNRSQCKPRGNYLKSIQVRTLGYYRGRSRSTHANGPLRITCSARQADSYLCIDTCAAREKGLGKSEPIAARALTCTSRVARCLSSLESIRSELQACSVVRPAHEPQLHVQCSPRAAAEALHRLSLVVRTLRHGGSIAFVGGLVSKHVAEGRSCF